MLASVRTIAPMAAVIEAANRVIATIIRAECVVVLLVVAMPPKLVSVLLCSAWIE